MKLIYGLVAYSLLMYSVIVSADFTLQKYLTAGKRNDSTTAIIYKGIPPYSRYPDYFVKIANPMNIQAEVTRNKLTKKK
jgi:hypothetical protein